MSMILQDNWGSTENDCYNARLEKEIQSLKECIWRLNQEKEQLKADKKWLLNKIRYALGEHWVPEEQRDYYCNCDNGDKINLCYHHKELKERFPNE